MIWGEYAIMVINNSIIVNNYGDNLIYSQDTPIIDNNWWGTTTDDSDAPVFPKQTRLYWE